MSAYAQPTHLYIILDMVKGIGNIFHRTNNRVRRCCVGGDMAIYFFASLQKYGGFCPFLFDKIFTFSVSTKNGVIFLLGAKFLQCRFDVHGVGLLHIFQKKQNCLN